MAKWRKIVKIALGVGAGILTGGLAAGITGLGGAGTAGLFGLTQAATIGGGLGLAAATGGFGGPNPAGGGGPAPFNPYTSQNIVGGKVVSKTTYNPTTGESTTETFPTPEQLAQKDTTSKLLAKANELINLSPAAQAEIAAQGEAFKIEAVANLKRPYEIASANAATEATRRGYSGSPFEGGLAAEAARLQGLDINAIENQKLDLIRNEQNRRLGQGQNLYSLANAGYGSDAALTAANLLPSQNSAQFMQSIRQQEYQNAVYEKQLQQENAANRRGNLATLGGLALYGLGKQGFNVFGMA